MDILIGSGDGDDEFKSKFNYHGFRYVIVEGSCEISDKSVSCFVETDLKRVGHFECSNDLLNKMHEVNDRTMRALNLGGVYVDCPTRERLGYGDAQVSIESSIMNYYMPNFYRKFIKDWVLRQDPITGAMPNVAPNYSGGGGLGWPGIVAAMTWKNYLYYGDKEILEYSYDSMRSYLDYIESRCVNGIYKAPNKKWESIGDWLAPGRGMDTNNWPSKELSDFFNNCYRVILWRIQYLSARALNKESDALYCERKIEKLRKDIHEFYYKEKEQIYVSDEQTYLLMPLISGIVPESLEEIIEGKLIKSLSSKNKIGTGMLGTYFLIQYLQEKGYNELLYKLVSHQDYPGWGYMILQGATIWWEQWNGYWSHIHSCFTSLDGWFYQGIAGIRPCEEFPGMKKIVIRPTFTNDLEYIDVSTESLYGKICVSWNRKNDDVLLNVEIPSNSSALLSLPKGYYIDYNNSITSDIELKSGKYSFVCKHKKLN